MKTISVSMRKGGNGKSTSTLNLAHAFAEKGKRVLIIDLDEQKNTSSAISHAKDGEKSIEDLLLEDDVRIQDVVRPTGWDGVSLLPASGNLSGVIKHLDGEVGGHLVLREKLLEATEFDIVLLDTSPSLNILVINALCASDYLFIPVSSKYFSLQGLTQTVNAFNKVKGRLNPDMDILAIAFVIHDKRNVLANEVVIKAKQLYGEYVCESIVGINIRVEEAQVGKKSILAYAPQDRGAIQYRALGEELLSRLYPES